MLFQFLKYLQPTHYFGLKTKSGTWVFPEWQAVSEELKVQFPSDDAYHCNTAKQYDVLWRLVNNGFIDGTQQLETVAPVSVYDNYVFTRKYFSKVWVMYTLLVRLLTFKNPIVELRCYFKTRKVKRYNYGDECLDYNNYASFKSPLLAEQPLVSVIIPTLNRYDYLKDGLKDLEQQDYSNFEVIVIDQSDAFQNTFYSNFNLNLKVEYQKEKALWLARNTAVKMSKGAYVLLFDDDSRVASDWITQHLKTLDYFNADISSGVSISQVGDSIPLHYQYFKISDQLDTGNVMLKTSIFKTVGLFDRQFEKQRMGDGEFGLRCFLQGFKNISNPKAKRVHLKVNSGGLREFGAWDAFRTKNLFQPRPIPSVLYYFRRYYGNIAALWALLKTVPASLLPYKLKRYKVLSALSVFIAILVLPVVLFQVVRSWSLASKKLKQGPLIEQL